MANHIFRTNKSNGKEGSEQGEDKESDISTISDSVFSRDMNVLSERNLNTLVKGYN